MKSKEDDVFSKDSLKTRTKHSNHSEDVEGGRYVFNSRLVT